MANEVIVLSAGKKIQLQATSKRTSIVVNVPSAGSAIATAPSVQVAAKAPAKNKLTAAAGMLIAFVRTDRVKRLLNKMRIGVAITNLLAFSAFKNSGFVAIVRFLYFKAINIPFKQYLNNSFYQKQDAGVTSDVRELQYMKHKSVATYQEHAYSSNLKSSNGWRSLIVQSLAAFLKSSTTINAASTGTSFIPIKKGLRPIDATISLTHNSGATAVAQSAVGGRSDWAATGNAVGMASNASVATFAGNTLAARGGQLDLDYVDFANKQSLTITKVELRFYVAQAGTVLGNGTLQLKWSKGGAQLLLEAITGNVDNLAAPRVHDITNQITSWNDLNALKSHVSTSTPGGNTHTASLNAVQVHIQATRTDILN